MGVRGKVREHLDRTLVCLDWLTLFPNVRLYHVATLMSNHSMLILKTPQTGQREARRQKVFRFEAMWLRDEQCKDVVNEAWERGRSIGTQHQFTECLDECRRSLSTWNKTTFGHLGQKIAALQKKLQALEGRQDGIAQMEEIHATKMELNRLMVKEEDIRHQRSRNYWLRSGIIILPSFMPRLPTDANEIPSTRLGILKILGRKTKR